MKEMYANNPSLIYQWKKSVQQRGILVDIFTAEKALAAAIIKHNH